MLGQESTQTGVTGPPPVRVIEEDEWDRIQAEHSDSGQVETLPDGSVSIPVFEEILVKKTVVRERIVVRKQTVSERRAVGGDLRKERVEVVPDPQVATVVDAGGLDRSG